MGMQMLKCHVSFSTSFFAADFTDFTVGRSLLFVRDILKAVVAFPWLRLAALRLMG
jgi:hypothetical protein